MRSARTDRQNAAINGPLGLGGPDRALLGVPRGNSAETLILWALTALVGVFLLAGCASGSAEEARQGEARDAVKTPALPEAQATWTAKEFFPPTPTPGPLPPPLPTLESLQITTSVGAGGEPQGDFASVPADAGTVYADALLDGVHAGQVISARWVDAGGNTIATARVPIDADANQQWAALPLTLNGSLAPGEYAVYLYAGERRLNSVVFSVSPAGSGPQIFSDPPVNPQPDRGGPSAILTPSDGGGNRTRSQDNGGQIDPNSRDAMYGNPGLDGNGQDSQDISPQEAEPVTLDPGVAVATEAP